MTVAVIQRRSASRRRSANTPPTIGAAWATHDAHIGVHPSYQSVAMYLVSV